jgi:hypothetical protein
MYSLGQPINRARTSLTGSDILGSGSNLFTSVGLDPRGLNELNTILQRIGAGAYRGAAEQTAFGLNAQAQMQQAIANLARALQTRDYTQTADRSKAALGSAFQSSSRQADAAARAAGLGEGYRAGQLGLGANRLAQSMGAVDAHYQDPARRDEDLMKLISLLQGATANPFLEQLLAINPQTQSSAQFRSQQNRSGLGGILGSVLGGLGNAALMAGSGGMINPALSAGLSTGLGMIGGSLR